MPEQAALAEARRRLGPSYGAGGGGDAFRERLEEWSAFAAPAVLVIALSLAEGGFGVTARHIAGLAIWLVIVGLLAMGAASRSAIAKPFYWAGGLLLAFALFSALSSLWSGSAELSVVEADRVLVYLGVFVAAFLIAQTDQRRQRFGEGIAVAIAVIAVIALASRLLPHAISVGPPLGSGPRLRYPLGYWNADGSLFALGSILLVWVSRYSLNAILRWLAVALLPIVLVALYFTYSRGGLLALAVGLLAMLVLSHDRLWLLATVAVGGLAALPALLAVQARSGIANNVVEPGAIDQGVTVALFVVLGVAIALALFAGLRQLEQRGGVFTGRAVAISRDRRVLRGIALVAALIGIGAAIAVGGRAWDQFSSNDLQLAQPQQRFETLSGAGRHDFYRVAIDAFEEEPIIGHGAGTYQFSWNQLRHQPITNKLAHSLYLQAFAELGLIGGLIILALVLLLLWTAFAAWRAASGRQREALGALFAVALAFAVGAAIDWLWEVAVVGAIFFLATGAAVAARCRQLVDARTAANGSGRQQRRYGLAIAGLAIAWLTALALIGPLLVDREIDASKAAATNGDLVGAENHAKTARTIEPWAASPYVQLGLVAQAQENLPLAAERLQDAIDREDHNWVLYYLLARVQHEAGEESAAQASLAKAKELNPLEACLSEGWEGC